MRAIETPLPGLLVIELQKHGDNRGFFIERFREDKFKSFGITSAFVQDNHSRSPPGVLRGLHYQTNPPQGKLVGVIRGKILDVAVDIRAGSPTFGKSFSIELSDDNAKLLWVPYGFAHGFCTFGDQPCDVIYKVTGLYNPQSEGGLAWNDPALGISWPVSDPQINARDKAWPLLKDLKPL